MLEIRSSTFFVPVLVLYTNDLIVIEQRLLQKVSQAPDFFRNSPKMLLDTMKRLMQ
ncbi:hypothetical protein [Nitrosomonas sp. Is37]|uniref:hypothetical protein n=1 Tax=Nitrosomonas sp. Is37 TaxID=3080535 RepID=UPI00294B7CE7|nr:hypothetical protein [Nitrosomonas sp. Is37]MDV6343941.1 hypothetical protein [Nitrosomonas sp. Is37]